MDMRTFRRAMFVMLLSSAAIGCSLHAQTNLAERGDLVLKAPYLIYTGQPTEMQVLWQLSATGSSTIDWGTDTTYALGSAQISEYGSSHQYSFTIPDLKNGVTYFYRVTAPGGSASTGSFHSAPSQDATDLKFFAYGDTRGPAEHDKIAGAMIADYTADPDYQSFVLASGDIVDNGESENDWTTQFFNPAYPHIRTFLADVPYQTCIGNHEGAGGLFARYFPYPFVGGRYWSFDYGPAHITVIDQYTSYDPGSPQLEWISKDLAASTKKWKFILLHEPGWSAGGAHANNKVVQTSIQPLCVKYGVAIVFGGHNHYYARAELNGVVHITTGGGGGPLSRPNLDSPHVVAAARGYHYCRIAIKGERLAFEAVTPEGKVLDSFERAAPSTSRD